MLFKWNVLLKLLHLCKCRCKYSSVFVNTEEYYFYSLIFPFYWIYWRDTSKQNYTGFRCTVLKHIFSTLSRVFTIRVKSPSVTIYPPSTPSTSFTPSSPRHLHPAVHVYEFFLFSPFLYPTLVYYCWKSILVQPLENSMDLHQKN